MGFDLGLTYAVGVPVKRVITQSYEQREFPRFSRVDGKPVAPEKRTIDLFTLSDGRIYENRKSWMVGDLESDFPNLRQMEEDIQKIGLEIIGNSYDSLMGSLIG